MGKTKIVRQLRNGQITIPKEFRDALHLDGEDVVAVTLEGDKLELRTLKAQSRGPGSPWVKELYDLFAPMRESLGEYGEEEINDAIDEALSEVRAEQ